MRRLFRVYWPVAAALLAACPGTLKDRERFGDGGAVARDGGAVVPSCNFEADVITTSCSFTSCHGGSSAPDLRNDPWAAMYNIPSYHASCGGRPVIGSDSSQISGMPLMQMLRGGAAAGGCGEQMPRGGASAQISAALKTCAEEWIAYNLSTRAGGSDAGTDAGGTRDAAVVADSGAVDSGVADSGARDAGTDAGTDPCARLTMTNIYACASATPNTCGAVFLNSAAPSCMEVCTRAGLTCEAAFDNVDADPTSCDFTEASRRDCSAREHFSEYCLCRVSP